MRSSNSSYAAGGKQSADIVTISTSNSKYACTFSFILLFLIVYNFI